MNLDEFKERFEVAVVERALVEEAKKLAAEKKTADTGKEQPLKNGVRFPRELPVITVRQESDCCGAGTYDPDDEDEDEFEDAEEELEQARKDLATACSLLQTAMHHLGFYGNPQTSKGRTFSLIDQRIMLATSEEIHEYLNRVWEETFE